MAAEVPSGDAARASLDQEELVRQLEEEFAKKILEGWLQSRANTCAFARSFSSRSTGVIRTIPIIAPGDLAGIIQASLSEAAKHGEAVILLFPRTRTLLEVATLISTLAADDNWKCETIDWDGYPHEDEFLVGMEWRTPDGRPSVAMGLGPLPSMPPTRRAPLVALALWPGQESNPYMRIKRDFKRAPRLSLADCRHGLDHDTHKELWKQTVDATNDFLHGLPDDASEKFRSVTFCLPSRAGELIKGL